MDNGSPFLEFTVKCRLVFLNMVKKDVKSICIRKVRVNPVSNIPGPLAIATLVHHS